MDKLFVNFLPPWVETNIQPAFYDKESGSVLQQTARMYAKVNCLVRMFNKLSKETKETVDEYIAKFVELKDFVDTYFENLDVQEEINIKLDEMAEDGTLQEIIETYLQANVTWTFDTVADMKASTNLIAGCYARTLGFYTVGDNGGATYRITDTGTANEMDVIAVGELYANLSNTDYVTPEMFGAKGDGTTDDRTQLNACINYSAVPLKVFKKNAIYRFDQNSAIVVPSNTTIEGNGATIIKAGKTEFSQKSRMFYIDAWGITTSNVSINGLTFDGDASNSVTSTTPLCVIHLGNGGYMKNVSITNCTFRNVQGHGLGVFNDNSDLNADECCENILIDNCNFRGIAGVGVIQSKIVSHITNCKFYSTSSEAITIDNGCRNCIVDGCEIKRYGYGGGIGIDESYNVRLVNNIIDGTNNTAPTEYKNAISLNAGTGVNYNTVIANNVLINNNTGIYIGTENTNSSFKAVAIGLTFTGNTFRNNSLRDVMLRYMTSDTRITARGNAYSAQFALGTAENVPRALLATSLNVDYQFNMSSLITAESGFTIVKSSAYLYEGELHYDLLVTATSGLSDGWRNVLTFPCSAYRIEENRIQFYNTGLTSIAGYKDVQVYATNYKAYWNASDPALAMFIRGSFPVNNR